MARQELSPLQLREKAGEADTAADDLLRQIEKKPTLKEPSSTDDGERVPSPALVGLGALRQAAERWRGQADRREEEQG